MVQQFARVFISYSSQKSDIKLAQTFQVSLEEAGHHVFMATENIQLGENWPERIEIEIQRCDYFLLLLSAQAATSEMVIEEVRRAKQLRDQRSDNRPTILPIQVKLAANIPLNYAIQGYLQCIQQREWQSDADTPNLLQEIKTIVSGVQRDNESQVDFLPLSNPHTTDAPFPPLPVAVPEIPNGQVNLASAFYVERPPVESRCLNHVLEPGALIRIKAPRQMGKTSLMARIIYHAKQAGYHTVPLNFQLADESIFSDLDQFLQWFCASIALELEFPDRLLEFWDDKIGSKMSCTSFFERFLLQELENPLVLGIDEIDLVFQYVEIASNFLGLLRAWNEKGKNYKHWSKLRLVMVHSTEVYIPLKMHQSPFNVGLPIELKEFNWKQVLDLAQRHGLPWSADHVQQLMAMVGGHPYLVRKALYHLTHQDLTLANLLRTAFTESGLFRDHLHRHWWNLYQHPELAKAFRKVVIAEKPVRLEPMQAFQLYSMGLVYLQGNEVTLRSNVYRQYFRDRLYREG